ncbi:MAG: putative toxin-antitoxin system toxin component, PIN family [Caldilineaceae bacterium]|nr:putative toxin-antitoxin system toxin component, PIN family [Caldilineaceae bacterium]
MRVVIDTNVLVRALITRKGTPGQLLEKMKTEDFFLVLSEEVFAELTRVLDYPHLCNRYRYTDEQKNRFLLSLRYVAIWVNAQETLRVVTEDESDNRFVELAVAGQARYLVTGDQKHLLRLRHYKGIGIVSPAEFLAMLATSQA